MSNFLTAEEIEQLVLDESSERVIAKKYSSDSEDRRDSSGLLLPTDTKSIENLVELQDQTEDIALFGEKSKEEFPVPENNDEYADRYVAVERKWPVQDIKVRQLILLEEERAELGVEVLNEKMRQINRELHFARMDFKANLLKAKETQTRNNNISFDVQHIEELFVDGELFLPGNVIQPFLGYFISLIYFY